MATCSSTPYYYCSGYYFLPSTYIVMYLTEEPLLYSSIYNIVHTIDKRENRSISYSYTDFVLEWKTKSRVRLILVAEQEEYRVDFTIEMGHNTATYVFSVQEYNGWTNLFLLLVWAEIHFFNQRIFPSNITNVLLFIFLKTSDQLFDIGKQNSRSDSSLLYSVVYQTEVKIQDDVKAEAVQLSFNIGWENHQKCSKRVTFYY